jgi:hypothetical protein
MRTVRILEDRNKFLEVKDLKNYIETLKHLDTTISEPQGKN